MQFEEAELDIVGIQEGRAHESRVTMGLHYQMFTSAATKAGMYGVQLWTRKKIGFESQAVFRKTARLMAV
eukprot:628596-Karenia_brevis.AAC.1